VQEKRCEKDANKIYIYILTFKDGEMMKRFINMERERISDVFFMRMSLF